MSEPDVKVFALCGSLRKDSFNRKFDATGRLIDEPTRTLISELLLNLAGWTRRIEGFRLVALRDTQANAS